MKLKTGVTSEKVLFDSGVHAAIGTNVRCQVGRAEHPDPTAMRTRSISQGARVVRSSNGDDNIIVTIGEEFEEVSLFSGLDVRNHSY